MGTLRTLTTNPRALITHGPLGIIPPATSSLRSGYVVDQTTPFTPWPNWDLSTRLLQTRGTTRESTLRGIASLGRKNRDTLTVRTLSHKHRKKRSRMMETVSPTKFGRRNSLGNVMVHHNLIICKIRGLVLPENRRGQAL